jgi:site-specific DNA-methyltransferase (adenine-specific)
MWKQLKRIGTNNCQYVFFTTTKFGIDLINSNPKWFRYDLVWEKSLAQGFLNCNYQPLRKHEMIYVFNNCGENDIEISRNLENREYAKTVLDFIGKSTKQIERELGNKKAEHFLQRVSTSQFGLPTLETYNKLIELYKIDNMPNFKPYEQLKNEKEIMTYNPQKTEGKPWKTKGGGERAGTIYGQLKYPDKPNITGDRQPTSILKFHQSDEKLHPTQKPLELCEWLIKTFSNESDNVLDFCMGSGTPIKACINTKRNYIGIEKDDDIFKIAEKRINEITS